MSWPARRASGPSGPTRSSGRTPAGGCGRGSRGPDAQPFGDPRPVALQEDVGPFDQPQHESRGPPRPSGQRLPPSGGRGAGGSGPSCQAELSPPGRSIRTTSAPRSARIIAACGARPYPGELDDLQPVQRGTCRSALSDGSPADACCSDPARTGRDWCVSGGGRAAGVHQPVPDALSLDQSAERTMISWPCR